MVQLDHVAHHGLFDHRIHISICLQRAGEIRIRLAFDDSHVTGQAHALAFRQAKLDQIAFFKFRGFIDRRTLVCEVCEISMVFAPDDSLAVSPVAPDNNTDHL
ncbi:hypothetical protein SAMN04515673_106124 [Poseidonocella sedimentorum]|uniref:Uncharacterized protein n=1 Tax=Poseidonocella sedimentorum TaxID=871652 RepID=A0A1I6DZG7_9RHOB|nr:hypothetical protein SAMN04515673_106124 [Poseidonocella sedimentorum]